MKSLLEGIQVRERNVSAKYEGLFPDPATGQGPEVLVVTCSDPRLDPGLARGTRPGQLFPIRTAGNIVPPYGQGGGEEATVEFAIRVMGIRTVIVCGHTDCGAMKSLLRIDELGSLPSVRAWLEMAEAALGDVGGLEPNVDAETRVRSVVKHNVVVQVENLKTHPSIADLLKKNELHLSGVVYDIASGEFFRCTEG